MPQMLWTNYFLTAQGYTPHETVLFQDNQSAILLERNGRRSSGQRTRHINIRYFFIKDCVESGKIVIRHCPTDKMVADYHTKPLQGKKFRDFHDQIMGHSPMTE